MGVFKFMSIEINYKSIVKKNSENLVLFLNDSLNVSGLKKHISSKEYTFINDLLKVSNKKSKIISYDISSKKKIILVSIDKNLKNSDLESLGARFYDHIKDIKQSNFIVNSDTAKNTSENIIGHFLHGIKLKSYIFEKYK